MTWISIAALQPANQPSSVGRVGVKAKESVRRKEGSSPREEDENAEDGDDESSSDNSDV